VEHNIHGIDIDSRATQIAKLTLWLRAQRAWKEQGIDVALRPSITHSNVVCAEPMPGERELLEDFIEEQFSETEREPIRQLLNAVFDKMMLAGEAGSLLLIEEEIRDAIHSMRHKWESLATHQSDLFSFSEPATLAQASSSESTNLLNLSHDFWSNIEARIYASLRDYSAQAEDHGGFQRRLFSGDAARGFAFIDVCRKRYDVALMNPPFGLEPASATKELKNISNSATSDIFAAFIARGRKIMERHGALGAITSRAFLLRNLWATSVHGGHLTLICA
jgi:hypothetical protein